eukprot:TRINITY_DN3262_c0_g1_i1.p1 TRINITY_DN3262_c0_g1~~TRINITY_DN3262_c0_g1_i1.p1  ORF type:complete len:361 (+),score=48.90 TRINITY_DN3262_c0_g1_i1:59-1141(+)
MSSAKREDEINNKTKITPPAAGKQPFRFEFNDIGPPRVRLSHQVMEELEEESSSRKLSHLVTFVGDAEAGKTELIERLINRKPPDPSTLSSTNDIVLRDHEMIGVMGSTETYTIRILDTEGVNNSKSSPAQRIACNQLLKHVAVKLSDIIIYVWSPTGDNHPGTLVEQAYQHLIELIGRPNAESERSQRRKPALLVILNKMPLRHCYKGVMGNFVPITSDTCTTELLEVDKVGNLESLFSSVRCCYVPLAGSKWRPPRQRDLIGSAIIPTMIQQIETNIHSLFISQHLKEQQYQSRAILSQSGWVASLPHVERLINNLDDRWGVPQHPTVTNIHQWNEEGRIAREKYSKQKVKKKKKAPS